MPCEIPAFLCMYFDLFFQILNQHHMVLVGSSHATTLSKKLDAMPLGFPLILSKELGFLYIKAQSETETVNMI